jgi:hypothetical protein
MLLLSSSVLNLTVFRDNDCITFLRVFVIPIEPALEMNLGLTRRQ